MDIYVYLWISMDIYEMLGTLWTFGQLLFGPRVRAEYRGARHAACRWAGAGAECSGGAAAGGALHSPANITYIYRYIIVEYIYNTITTITITYTVI